MSDDTFTPEMIDAAVEKAMALRPIEPTWILVAAASEGWRAYQRWLHFELESYIGRQPPVR